MQLVVPSIKYKESFLEALEEYQKSISSDRLDIYALNAEMLREDFDSYVKRLLDEEKGIGLPPGYVPQTTYWLIDEGQFVGRVSIRHRLTEHLLKEGGHIGYDIRPSKRRLGYGKKILSLVLPKVKELGITRALITCDETNIGSKKIIERNGGILENSILLSPDKPHKLRYWISL
jgi:predicted acetyltransferase